MDRVYRHMKHIYDLTRPAFLAGRARLRSKLRPSDGDAVLEVGCGTARNLILLARRYPHARFVGIDISREMLALARRNVARAGLNDRIELCEGELSDHIDERNVRYDRIFLSYSLSMMRDRAAVLTRARDALRPASGCLLVVDFGSCSAWPGWGAARLRKNLSYFEVFPPESLTEEIAAVCPSSRFDVRVDRFWGGYAELVSVVPIGIGSLS
jgi:S-adenosylmethionine-diacylgycerolhomoserine-N-methlytransferase